MVYVTPKRPTSLAKWVERVIRLPAGVTAELVRAAVKKPQRERSERWC
jgi:hypothetical protein